MPALPFAPGIAKIVLVQSMAGVTINNVLHATSQVTTPTAVGDLQTLANTVRSSWVTNVIPLQSNSLTLTDCVVTDLTNDTGASATSTGSNVGGLASAASPANTAVCWSWKISNRYRGGHPRTYIAGLAQANVLNANTLTAAHVTAHAAAAAAVRTAVNALVIGATTWQLCCVSYYKNKALRPVGINFIYTGVSVDSRIDSQRRRLGRDRT